VRTSAATAPAARLARAFLDRRIVRLTAMPRFCYSPSPVRVTFLGTGTSHGVPMIGCECAVCRSADPRDHRFRTSVYLEMNDGLRVLVDATPDLRSQALRFDVRRVDAMLLTHAHADHVMGLDDVRSFNELNGTAMPVYGLASSLDSVKRMFAYAFGEDALQGGGVPAMRLYPIGGMFCLGRQEVVPVPLPHGPWTVLGFRLGAFAYLTDCNALPDAALERLVGVEYLVIDALRHRPHPTHFTVAQAVSASKRIGARRTWLTHIAHDLGHADTTAGLPAGVALAHDGLVVDVA
jgi:phosphoribosyl 1,2-cyclic phosphate phosphodiesterase